MSNIIINQLYKFIYFSWNGEQIISRVILKNNLKISLIFPFQTFSNFFLYKNEYF